MMREWRVVVCGVGDIGSVTEDGETNARLAALSKYGEEGARVAGENTKPHIYDNDDFEVY